MREGLRGYIICAMPRSGSTYLCELLSSTGVLGRPTEYLNPDFLRFMGKPTFPNDPRARMRQGLQLGVTDNGVYGLKILTTHFDHLAYPNWIHDLPRLKFIYLAREDILGQALSYVKAQQTQKWYSTLVPSGQGVYDEALIQTCLNELVLDEARWRAFFARNGLAPFRASYEALLQEPQGVVSAIGTMLALDREPRIDATKLTLEIQRDDETLVWRERFLRDNADMGYLDSNRIPLQFSSAAPSRGGHPALANGDKIVVWGAGMAAQTIIAQRFDLSNIDFFIDTDARKQGETCLGLPIRPPEALLNEKSCVILISSEKYESTIRLQISRQFGDHVRQIITLSDLTRAARAPAASQLR